MTLFFRRSPQADADLERLLAAQQDPGGAEYRRWLTPEEFASRFGASEEALSQTAAWLQRQGFRIEEAARGRGWLSFSGSAGQVRRAFNSEIHRYESPTEKHYAPSARPMLPKTLKPVVLAIRGLDDFYLSPPHRATPLFNASDGNHFLSPGDIASLYNLTPLHFNITGYGQTIAIIGEAPLNMADVRLFRSTFNLAPADPQVLLIGDAPSASDSATLEAVTDVEWVGAVATDAQLIYVYANDAISAVQAAIDQNLAPVISFSFSGCERDIPADEVAAIHDLARQANAQGITWIASSGDSGAASCDAKGSAIATEGLGVGFPASMPEVTAVGGTRLNEPAAAWGANGADQSSLLGYQPETAWNDTADLNALWATGGGRSTLFPKPTWQQGVGVPDNGARNVPDVSLTASIAHDPYLVANGGKFYGVGGTSLSTPVFAGIVSLAEQSLGRKVGTPQALGNINPSLYAMAQSSDGANYFHDITTGDNIVPCQIGTPDCTSGSIGYSAGPGYDLVTGLGSLNGLQFTDGFGVPTMTTLSVSPAQVTEGDTVTLTATVLDYAGNPAAGEAGFYYAADEFGPSYILNASGSATLNASGSATATVLLNPGTYSIAARYLKFGGPGPEARFLPSASAPTVVTVVPRKPAAPALAAPANQATGVTAGASLSWVQNQSVAAVYDVYFGTTSPPPFWGSVQTSVISPNGMAASSTYYWKVVARTSAGSAESPIWSFQTGSGPVYRLSRFAGNGQWDSSGDGGPALQAGMAPGAIAFDAAGNLYMSDKYRVRRITTDGVITTVAGDGTTNYSGDGGPAISAGLGYGASALAVDRDGTLYIALANDRRIRKVAPDGTISTIAGDGTFGFDGDGGPASAARLANPVALALDASGALYIADAAANCVRKIAAGTISTAVGQCSASAGYGGDGGSATAAGLRSPQGLAIDSKGNLYISELGGDIRVVSDGTIGPVAGYFPASGPVTGSLALNDRVIPSALAVDGAGNLYFQDISTIGRITNGVYSLVAGTSPPNPCCALSDGAVATVASIFGAGLAADNQGRLYASVSSSSTPYIWRLSLESAPPSPSITAGGVRNAAGLAAGPVAPGSIAAAFGSFALDQPAAAVETPLPSILDGLSLQVAGGKPTSAPLFYASSGQVNLQIPWELEGQTTAQLTPVVNSQTGAPQTVGLAAYAPGIFVVNAQGQGAVVDGSGRLVDATNPASSGVVLQIYCTGLGAVTGGPATGVAATSIAPTVATAAVQIGGIEATVLYSGLAPGTVGGYQVNVVLPAGVAQGSTVPLTLKIGGAVSNTVTIAAH